MDPEAHPEAAALVGPTVTDVRQYVYCPRVVYYTYCQPLRKDRKGTYKMQAGEESHEDTEKKEARRSLRAYGLDEGERHFAVHLHSDHLGLTSLLDMVITTRTEVIPVEYKHSTGSVGLHHKYQLAAYALLAQEKWDRPVRRGFFYFIPPKRAEEMIITGNRRHFVRRTLWEIRRMIDSEEKPAPTRHSGRCTDCEFRRYCDDRGL